MPVSTYQATFSLTSLTAPSSLPITISNLADVGASSNSQLPPTTGQLWPRITQK